MSKTVTDLWLTYDPFENEINIMKLRKIKKIGDDLNEYRKKIQQIGIIFLSKNKIYRKQHHPGNHTLVGKEKNSKF